MTNGAAPSPSPAPQPHKNDAEYARKLALAILSTLESKGLLSKMDVEAILHVAHRTAMTARPASEDTPVNEGAEGEAQANPDTASKDMAKNAAETSPVTEQNGTDTAQSDTAAASASVLTAPIEVKRPLGPAVLGTRWVKPDAGVTDAVRDAAAEVATAHEAGAVKVTGQATKVKDRPLAPAILTDLQAKAATPTAAPAEPELSESEVKSQVESNLKAIESKAQAQQKQAQQEQGRVEDAEMEAENGKPKKEGAAVPVIDFDLE